MSFIQKKITYLFSIIWAKRMINKIKTLNVFFVFITQKRMAKQNLSQNVPLRNGLNQQKKAPKLIKAKQTSC